MSVENITKILCYIYPISKEKITYKNVSFEPVKHLYLRKTLFCKDECLLCSRCCIAEDNIYLPFEVNNMYYELQRKEIDTVLHKLNGKGYSNIEELIDSLEEISVVINDKRFKLFKSSLTPNTYTFEDRGELKRCHWDLPTEDGRLGCGIHTVSSLTCKMPHIRFLHNSKTNTTSIGHSQYGRNWALKCPANVSKTEYSDDSFNTVISNFELLKKYCEYFEIDTYCDDILKILYKIREQGIETCVNYCDKDIVEHRRKLFNV